MLLEIQNDFIENFSDKRQSAVSNQKSDPAASAAKNESDVEESAAGVGDNAEEVVEEEDVRKSQVYS